MRSGVRAARGAVTAAFLAQDGVTGPFRPLEGEAGLFNFFERGEFDLAPLMDDLRGEWRMRDDFFDNNDDAFAQGTG